MIVATFKMQRVDLERARARERLFSEIIAIDIRSSQWETRFGFQRDAMIAEAAMAAQVTGDYKRKIL